MKKLIWDRGYIKSCLSWKDFCAKIATHCKMEDRFNKIRWSVAYRFDSALWSRLKQNSQGGLTNVRSKARRIFKKLLGTHITAKKSRNCVLMRFLMERAQYVVVLKNIILLTDVLSECGLWNINPIWKSKAMSETGNVEGQWWRSAKKF